MTETENPAEMENPDETEDPHEMEEEVSEAEFNTLVAEVRKNLKIQISMPKENILHIELLEQLVEVADKIPYEDLVCLMEEFNTHGKLMHVTVAALKLTSVRQSQLIRRMVAGTGAAGSAQDDEEGDDDGGENNV